MATRWPVDPNEPDPDEDQRLAREEEANRLRRQLERDAAAAREWVKRRADAGWAPLGARLPDDPVGFQRFSVSDYDERVEFDADGKPLYVTRISCAPIPHVEVPIRPFHFEVEVAPPSPARPVVLRETLGQRLLMAVFYVFFGSAFVMGALAGARQPGGVLNRAIAALLFAFVLPLFLYLPLFLVSWLLRSVLVYLRRIGLKRLLFGPLV